MRLLFFACLSISLSVFPVVAETPVLGRFVTELGTVELSKSDIREASINNETDDFALSLILQDEPSAKLRRLTEASVGKSMSILVCGKELSRAVIREPISGQLYIVGVQSELATMVNNVLNGKGNCSDD